MHQNPKRGLIIALASLLCVVLMFEAAVYCGNGHSVKFACAVNCMDGRTQQPVTDYLKSQYHVDYADAITEPGVCKILAENLDSAVVADIKKRIDISVKKHQSKVVAIVAHPECAGNPVDKSHQIGHLHAAYKQVKSFNLPVEIILLWVEEDWKTVQKIDPPAMSK